MSEWNHIFIVAGRGSMSLVQVLKKKKGKKKQTTALCKFKNAVCANPSDSPSALHSGSGWTIRTFLPFIFPLCIVVSVFITVEMQRQVWWKTPLPAAPYVIMPLQIPVPGTSTLPAADSATVTLFQANISYAHPRFLHTPTHSSPAASLKYSPATTPLRVISTPLCVISAFAFNLPRLICICFWVSFCLERNRCMNLSFCGRLPCTQEVCLY